MIKKIFAVFALFSLLTNVGTPVGCSATNTVYATSDIEFQMDSINEDKARMIGLSDKGKEKEVVYVPDYVYVDDKEILVQRIMSAGYYGNVQIRSMRLKKIYFPWSIYRTIDSKDPHKLKWRTYHLEYIISASTVTAIEYDSTTLEDILQVVPAPLYFDSNPTWEWKSIKRYCAPANIAFLFNYEESPNKDYFFVDLLEESGKITKPPYDPKGEGYTFEGWYKEPECVNKWNFDTDEVVITFDGEGNRIYEEIKLYAKWTPQS